MERGRVTGRGGERESLEEENSKRGAARRKTNHRPLGTLLRPEQKPRSRGTVRGQVSNHLSGGLPNDRGAEDSPMRRPGCAEREAPERESALDTAAGWNKPAKLERGVNRREAENA